MSDLAGASAPSKATEHRRSEKFTCLRKTITRPSLAGGSPIFGAKPALDIVDELAAPDMLLQYSLYAPRRGREDIKAFMTGFRDAFPDLNFWGAADLIAEGDYVVGRWEGGGTHTGPAFSDFLIGALPPATGRKMRFTGTTVLRVQDGKITEEVGLDDGVTALKQLELIRPVVWPA